MACSRFWSSPSSVIEAAAAWIANLTPISLLSLDVLLTCLSRVITCRCLIDLLLPSREMSLYERRVGGEIEVQWDVELNSEQTIARKPRWWKTAIASAGLMHGQKSQVFKEERKDVLLAKVAAAPFNLPCMTSWTAELFCSHMIRILPTSQTAF